MFAPASFKGAQPICYYCRQAGHVKKDCPALTALTCFRCHESGHTKKNCRYSRNRNIEINDTYKPETTTRTTYEADLNEYIKLRSTEKNELVDKKGNENRIEEEGKENRKDYDDESLPTFDDEILDDVSIPVKEKIVDLKVNTKQIKGITRSNEGSLASRYAPIEVRSSMNVDQPNTSSYNNRYNTRNVSAKKVGSHGDSDMDYLTPPVTENIHMDTTRQGHD